MLFNDLEWHRVGVNAGAVHTFDNGCSVRVLQPNPYESRFDVGLDPDSEMLTDLSVTDVQEILTFVQNL